MLKTERKSATMRRACNEDGGGLWVIENASLVDDADGHFP